MKIFNTGEKILEGKDCQASIGMVKLADKVPLLTLENTCKTIIVEIPENKRKIETNADISEELSKKIVRTWDIILKGTVNNLWSDDWTFFGGDQGCMVMYNINLKYLPEDKYTFKDLNNFMSETSYKKVDGLPLTYRSYIQYSGKPGALIFPEAQTEAQTNKGQLSDLKITKTIYAISILSPKHSVVDLVLGNEPQATVLAFSTLDYAENELGCKLK